MGVRYERDPVQEVLAAQLAPCLFPAEEEGRAEGVCPLELWNLLRALRLNDHPARLGWISHYGYFILRGEPLYLCASEQRFLAFTEGRIETLLPPPRDEGGCDAVAP